MSTLIYLHNIRNPYDHCLCKLIRCNRHKTLNIYNHRTKYMVNSTILISIRRKNESSKYQSSIAVETRNKLKGEMAERSEKKFLISNVNNANALFCSLPYPILFRLVSCSLDAFIIFNIFHSFRLMLPNAVVDWVSC